MHRRAALSLLGTGTGLGLAQACMAPLAQAAAQALQVAYAGSMGAVMDKGLGPAIERSDGVQFQGRGAGAFGLAHLLASRQIRADVFVSITPGPMQVVQRAGLAGPAQPIASTEMVIAYSPQGPHASAFADAAAGRRAWYEVLERPGMRFGRTDPATDPQGRNIVFAMLLAERYYRKPGLARRLLGDFTGNTTQIFSEPSLLSRLESGQIDASSGYLSSVISHKLPYIRLPAQVNLSDPGMAAKWYDTVHFSIPGPDGKPKRLSIEPLVFYAAALGNAPNPAGARAFVELLRSEQGQALLHSYGYSRPKGSVLEPSAVR